MKRRTAILIVCVLLGARSLFFVLWWRATFAHSAGGPEMSRAAAASVRRVSASRPRSSLQGAAPSSPRPDPEETVTEPQWHATFSDLEALRARRLLFPVESIDPLTIIDNFAEMRGGHVHEAIDIQAPRGTPVLAVDDGVVEKLFSSKQGGLTLYQFDSSQTYCYYYAHLDRYAEGLADGMALRKGDRVGYVGTTGNAPPSTPHLHFTIFKLGADKRWWEGEPINPFLVWAPPP